MNRLEIAIQTARAAGGVLRRKLHQTRTVRSKGFRDPVTDADLAAQEVALRHLTQAFPGDAILSEEGRHDIDLAAATPTWVIDPLDGTANYAHHLPAFGVSIGLVSAGEPWLGVVYDPLRDELFYGERGQGAFVRQGRGRPRPLRVSPTANLAEAVVAMGNPRAPEMRRLADRYNARMGEVCNGLRNFGSAALHLAYVAAGRLEACCHLTLQPWDVAAGALLITEAGGQLATFTGEPWRLTQLQVVADNGHLHAQVLAALASAAPA